MNRVNKSGNIGIDGAIFSKDRKHRYELWRYLPGGTRGTVLFILLNPSTADEKKNDPTVRRCIWYAVHWGFSKIFIGNLFGFRATYPKKMKNADDPFGPDNFIHIENMALKSELVVAGWGTHGAFVDGGKILKSALVMKGIKLHYLKLTEGGFPSHPLYLPKKLKPRRWI